MLRPVVWMLASALTVSGVYLLGWSVGERIARPDAPTTSQTTATCRTPAPTSADDLNAILEGLDDEPPLLGADHGESVRLADGRRFFAFGDTIRDDEVVRGFWAVNSVMVLDQGCIRTMTPPGQGAAIPSRSDGVGYWPMSMRAVPTASGSQVQMLATRVRKTGQDEFDSLGPAYVVFDVPSGGAPRLARVTDLGPDRRDPSFPTWGAAMWESGGHLYLFGTASNATKTTFGWSLHVARTTPGGMSNPSTWEYWDGSAWRRGSGREASTPAGTLVPADGGVSHILSVFTRGGSWYAVSKEGDFFGDNLAVWKAPAPTGPWTKHVIAPLTTDDLIRRYSPQAHPDLQTASGRLLVSFSQGPWQSRYFRSHPEMYRPQFLEITLP